MKIAIIGYGRMGREIEKVALQRGHEIVSVIDVDNRADMASARFAEADVAIEFSVPAAAAANLAAAAQAGVPVVCGTTGWLDAAGEEFVKRTVAQGATFMISSNFSIGVNVVMAASRLLARLLTPFPAYSASLQETHHTHKLDHPSGTAITIADQLISDCGRYTSWAETTEPAAGVLPVQALRQGEVPGIHTVTWDSPDDTITLRHEAKSRHGFATGAVAAAEWLATALRGKRYTMTDMLGI